MVFSCNWTTSDEKDTGCWDRETAAKSESDLAPKTFHQRRGNKIFCFWAFLKDLDIS